MWQVCNHTSNHLHSSSFLSSFRKMKSALSGNVSYLAITCHPVVMSSVLNGGRLGSRKKDEDKKGWRLGYWMSAYQLLKIIYLTDTEGGERGSEILRILSIYIFCTCVERALLRACNMVCTSTLRGHGFTSHPTEDDKEKASQLATFKDLWLVFF